MMMMRGEPIVKRESCDGEKTERWVDFGKKYCEQQKGGVTEEAQNTWNTCLIMRDRDDERDDAVRPSQRPDVGFDVNLVE